MVVKYRQVLGVFAHLEQNAGIVAAALIFSIAALSLGDSAARASNLDSAITDDDFGLWQWNIWQWGGYQRSSSPAGSSAATSTNPYSSANLNAAYQLPLSMPSVSPAPAAVSPAASSLNYTAATTVGSTSTVGNYNAWQWSGYSRSGPVNATTVLPATSSPVTLNALTAPVVSSNQSSPTGIASADSGTASLSGYVYLDLNNNGMMETSDLAIADAEVQLSMIGNSNPLLTVATNATGSYTFSNLGAGRYTLTLLTTASQPGSAQVGYLYDGSGNVVPDGMGAAGQDSISGIALDGGYVGTYYNFGLSAYPISLLSKRMLLNDSPPIINTIPEPSSLLLLLAAGVCLAGFARRRSAVRA